MNIQANELGEHFWSIFQDNLSLLTSGQPSSLMHTPLKKDEF